MNEEMLKKAKGAKSAEELKSLAAGAGLTLTDEQATEYYAKINRSGELADEELESVAGGGCGHKYVYLDQNNLECPICHARPLQVLRMEEHPIIGDVAICKCPQCKQCSQIQMGIYVKR